MRIILAVSAVLVASLALWLVTLVQSINELSVENPALRAQVEQLTAQNERLTNAMIQAGGSPSLNEVELGELLRLRGEAGRLRRENQELTRLREQNQQLRAALPAGQGVRAADLTADATYWPKDSWVFAGYATPESTIQSLLWSASNGNMRSILAGLTGEAQKQLEEELKQKSEAEMAAESARDIAKFKSCRVLEKEYLPGDAIRLTLQMDGENAETNKLILKRVGNEWKISGEDGG